LGVELLVIGKVTLAAQQDPTIGTIAVLQSSWKRSKRTKRRASMACQVRRKVMAFVFRFETLESVSTVQSASSSTDVVVVVNQIGFTHLAVNLQLRINIAAKIVLAVNTFSKQKRS
jgi:hypothetical protein